MKYKNIINHPFQGKRISNNTAVAIISGIAIGAAIGALFATEKGKNVRNYLTVNFSRLIRSQTSDLNAGKAQLGNLIGDVRGHIKQVADGLLGPSNNRQNTSNIQVAGTPSNSWRSTRARSVYPKTPDPSIKIV